MSASEPDEEQGRALMVGLRDAFMVGLELGLVEAAAQCIEQGLPVDLFGTG